MAGWGLRPVLAGVLLGILLTLTALHVRRVLEERQDEDGAVSVRPEGVVRLRNGQAVLVLCEDQGQRRLTVPLAAAEAAALEAALRGEADGLTSLSSGSIVALGGHVRGAMLSAVASDGTLAAQLVLERGGQHVMLTARPVDALVIALSQRAPLTATSAVLDAAGVTPQEARTLGAKGKPAARPPAGAAPVLSL